MEMRQKIVQFYLKHLSYIQGSDGIALFSQDDKGKNPAACCLYCIVKYLGAVR